MSDVQTFWSLCAEGAEFLSQRRSGAVLMESRHGDGQTDKQGLYQRKRSDKITVARNTHYGHKVGHPQHTELGPSSQFPHERQQRFSGVVTRPGSSNTGVAAPGPIYHRAILRKFRVTARMHNRYNCAISRTSLC